jgi:protein arginine kinase activator
MHKGTRHVGKVPAVLRQSQDMADKLKSLQKKLEKAIANEDFEAAATLRDEVKALRAQMSELATK